MSDQKDQTCCCTSGDLRFVIQSGDKGIVIRVESDDPRRAEALKARLDCCGEGDRTCC